MATVLAPDSPLLTVYIYNHLAVACRAAGRRCVQIELETRKMNALVSSLAVGPLLYDDGVATVGPDAPRTAPQFAPTSHSYRASDDAREGRGAAQASYDRPRHDGSGNGGERMAGGRQPRRRSGGSDDRLIRRAHEGLTFRPLAIGVLRGPNANPRPILADAPSVR